MPKSDTGQSLRVQIVEAMNRYAKEKGWADRTPIFNADMFDEAIMPVLEQAMEAGQLLVGRNTKDRKPVDVRIKHWLEEVVGHCRMLEKEEAVISKRQCLKVIYQFGENAEKALTQVNMLEQKEH